MADQTHILPAGFRFRPTDEELIRAFLYPKVMGIPMPWNGCIVQEKEKELYGGDAPWEVFSDIDDENCSIYRDIKEEGNKSLKTVYVFTKLTKAAPNYKKRKSRVAGGGTWDGQTAKKSITHSSNGNVIGETKMLSFLRSEKKKTTTADDGANWIMHEYSLSGNVLEAIGKRENDTVLCKITKKSAPIDNVNQGQGGDSPKPDDQNDDQNVDAPIENQGQGGDTPKPQPQHELPELDDEEVDALLSSQINLEDVDFTF